MTISSFPVRSGTLLAPVLKQMHLDGARAIFQSRGTLFARLNMNKNNVVGSNILAASNTGRHEGFGGSHATDGLAASATLGSSIRLADPGYEPYLNRKGQTADFSLRGKISGKEMAQTKNDVGAFIRLSSANVGAGFRDLKYDLNGQLFSDGSGRLGIISSLVGTGDGGGVNVRHPFDRPSAASSGAATTGTNFNHHRIRPGMYVGILDVSACTAGVANQVFHVTAAGGPNSIVAGIRHFKVSTVSGATITLTAPGGTALDLRADTTGNIDNLVAAGDILVRSTVRSPSEATPTAYTSNTGFHYLTGYRRKDATETSNTHYGAAELIGLPAYADDGNVYLEMAGSSTPTLGGLEGLEVGSAPDWAGYVIEGATPGTAEAGTRLKFMKAINAVEKLGEANTSFLVMHPDTEALMIEKFVHSDIQYQNLGKSSGEEVAEGRIRFQGREILTDMACPIGTVFTYYEPELELKMLLELDMVNGDGSNLFRSADHYDYQWAAVMSAQTWAERRNRFAAIYDLQATAW